MSKKFRHVGLMLGFASGILACGARGDLQDTRAGAPATAPEDLHTSGDRPAVDPLAVDDANADGSPLSAGTPAPAQGVPDAPEVTAPSATTGATPPRLTAACFAEPTASCATCAVQAMASTCVDAWQALDGRCSSSRRCAQEYCFCDTPDCWGTVCECIDSCTYSDDRDGCRSGWSTLLNCIRETCEGDC